ncbi:hypothetical protein DFJ73DRAFT_850988 [Zopfochytrium polystomum]|nr:hypothetical protein DFJ73DRAFT_850988 [Zopfochytrium polystomum]
MAARAGLKSTCGIQIGPAFRGTLICKALNPNSLPPRLPPWRLYIIPARPAHKPRQPTVPNMPRPRLLFPNRPARYHCRHKHHPIGFFLIAVIVLAAAALSALLPAVKVYAVPINGERDADRASTLSGQPDGASAVGAALQISRRHSSVRGRRSLVGGAADAFDGETPAEPAHNKVGAAVLLAAPLARRNFWGSVKKGFGKAKNFITKSPVGKTLTTVASFSPIGRVVKFAKAGIATGISLGKGIAQKRSFGDIMKNTGATMGKQALGFIPGYGAAKSAIGFARRKGKLHR